jgi:DNA-binding beta-propeller fold protein YncE
MCVFRQAKGLVAVLFMMALCLGACVQIGNHRDHEPVSSKTLSSAQPQISLFLTGSAREAVIPKVRVTVSALEIFDGGQWVSLLRQPQTISATQAGMGVLMDRVQVPTGQYSRLRYQISQAVMARDGHETMLQLPPQPVEYPLPRPVTLVDGDSLSLFLNWDWAASLARAPLFTPAITPAAQKIPLTTELAFVSCPEINTVYIIRTDQNRVCGSWGIPGRPTYLHAVKEQNRLYCLASDQAVIKVLELSSGRLQDQIRIPMAVKPSFMALDRAGKNAYLLDQATATVYRVDLGSGSLAAQGRVGGEMDFAVFLDDEQLLAVSSERSHQVLLLDPVTLEVRQTVTVGSNPQGVLGYDHDLYVAEGRANTVSVHKADNGPIVRQTVGRGPTRLLAHDRTIFVANSRGGTITILLPGVLTVQKEVPIAGTPGEMALSPGRNWLYVTDTQGGGVVVLDLTSHRLAARIDLHTRPLDIEVIR